MKFTIEQKLVSERFSGFFKKFEEWKVTRKYTKESSRDQALKVLRNRGKGTWEYRKGPNK